MQALGKLVPGRRAEVFAVLHKGAHFLAQGVIIPGSATHPQNGARFREQLLTGQRIERRDQGGTAQIARDPTNHDDTRIRWGARCQTGALHFESVVVHPWSSSGPVPGPRLFPMLFPGRRRVLTYCLPPLTIPLVCCQIKSFRHVTRVARPEHGGAHRPAVWAAHHEALGSDAVVAPHAFAPQLVLGSGWCVSGATPQGQPWTPTVRLPYTRDGLSALRMEGLCPFCRPSLCRHVHRALLRHGLRDVTPYCTRHSFSPKA